MSFIVVLSGYGKQITPCAEKTEHFDLSLVNQVLASTECSFFPNTLKSQKKMLPLVFFLDGYRFLPKRFK